MILNFRTSPPSRAALRTSAGLRAVAVGLVTALPVVITACGGGDEGSGSDAKVVASTTHAADLARNVAGDRAEVTGILPPNADPHDYEPRPSDAEAVADADLVIQSGGDLDLWLDEVVSSSGTVAAVTTLIDSVEEIAGEPPAEDEQRAAEEEDEEEEGEDHADEVDPHWWQSPRNAVAAVEEIRDRLIEVDPHGRDDYNANADDYIADLERLDRAIAACMRDIPADRRKLVTSHDSLGYFADRYDVEIVGAAIPALTTQAQPSAGETAELVDLIREQGVKAVFGEAGVNTDLERAIADETGAVVGGELWADTLGPEDSGAETYVEATTANAEAIAKGLSGGAGGCGFPGG